MMCATMDWITAFQSVYSRLRSHWMFSFRPELYDWNGAIPDPLREKQTRWGMRLGTRLFSRAYPGVPGRVHIHDTMLQDDGPESMAHYRRVGLSAMENIEASLAAAGRPWESIGACLDMACGYGRVQRHLARRIAGWRITACEVVLESILFCAEEFGAKPLRSTLTPETMEFPDQYDLIWVGSLLTHLRPAQGMALAAHLGEQLKPGGVLIFSTQGPSCLDNIPFYGFVFEGKEGEFRGQMAREAAAYLPYFAHEPNYGITFLSPQYVRWAMGEAAGGKLRELRHAERGWDAHQDVWSFQRESAAGD
jgi:SAM-dependent methyltransferase